MKPLAFAADAVTLWVLNRATAVKDEATIVPECSYVVSG
jgi:hypothetical protein